MGSNNLSTRVLNSLRGHLQSFKTIAKFQNPNKDRTSGFQRIGRSIYSSHFTKKANFGKEHQIGGPIFEAPAFLRLLQASADKIANLSSPELTDNLLSPHNVLKPFNVDEYHAYTSLIDVPAISLERPVLTKHQLEKLVQNTIAALDNDAQKFWIQAEPSKIINKYLGDQEEYHAKRCLEKLQSFASEQSSIEHKLLQRALALNQIFVANSKKANELDVLALVPFFHLSEPSLRGRTVYSTGDAQFIAVSLLVDLSKKGFIRLHIYPQKLQDGEDHSHRANGMSFVLDGAIINQTSSMKEVEAGALESIYVNDTSGKYGAGLINTKQLVEVEPQSRHFYKAGESYSLKKGILHRVATDYPTITLFHFMEDKQPAEQAIIRPNGEEYIPGKSRTNGLTPEMVSKILIDTETRLLQKLANRSSNSECTL